MVDNTQEPNATRPEMVKLRAMVNEDPVEGWDVAWKENVTPWDHGIGHPPLQELLKSGEIEFPTSGRALVPGCGRGYDAICIASLLGLDTLGLDFSSTAVQSANDYLATVSPLPQGGVTYQQADFFSFQVTDDQRFDIVYDYTFFVAIPPSHRNEWGDQMRLLIKPGGYLITLVYPLDPPTDVGPPYFVRPEHYIEPLGDGWEKVLDKVPEVSTKTHVGRERMIVWRRALE